MSIKAIFEGLVFGENEQPLAVGYVGSEACYVIDDNGFLRHISAEKIDRQVLEALTYQIEDNKDIITEQTAKMIGQDDLFTHAIIQNQLENIDGQIDHLMTHGLPEEGRAYMGMIGFKIIVNFHGEVLRVEQPAMPAEEDE